MFDMMYATEGIGLAAPQVGINKRLLVFNKMAGEVEQEIHEMVLANPRINARSQEMMVGREGCLSFPRIEGNVARCTWIEVSYQDLNGNKVEKTFEGDEAIIFQHEYDHLDKVISFVVFVS
jgi:peptide deformylase